MENAKFRRIQSRVCLRNSQADVGQDRREKSFFSGILESFIFFYKIRPIGDRPGKVWLGGNFKLLAFHSHWSNVAVGIFFFLLLVFGYEAEMANLSNFHQASINIVHQTRLTFDLEIETTYDHASFRTRSHECR